ncbi:MAG: hypothetical protein PUG87_11085, partial [Eubacteriales bacterium]|nr:hypothetical protein [Eubacteriales bacterium]
RCDMSLYELIKTGLEEAVEYERGTPGARVTVLTSEKDTGASPDTHEKLPMSAGQGKSDTGNVKKFR